MSWFFWLFAVFYVLHLVVELALDLLNLRYIDQAKDHIPAPFAAVVSEPDYQKSIAYTQAKTRFHWSQTAVIAFLTWALILSGAFGAIDIQLRALLPNHAFLSATIYPFAIGFIFYMFSLPFSYLHQFRLEERFGFNKMTLKTFVGDQIRGAVLGLILGWPIFALILLFIEKSGDLWWLYACGAVLLFQFFMAAIFPVLIAPIYYKFTPLADGELKDRLQSLAKRIGFAMSGIYTIDGSRRSAHSNAFFAGIGKTRRIVLFDTLVKSMNTEEIEAVIAHEMGHNIQKHSQKQLLSSSVMTVLSFYVLSLALTWPPFFQAFGVTDPSPQVGIVLFSLFSSVFLFPISPLFKWFSRKYEYEADQFAAKTTGGTQSMVQALLKLSKDNLSNLTPHPWYSFYHYTHPAPVERINAINGLSCQGS